MEEDRLPFDLPKKGRLKDIDGKIQRFAIGGQVWLRQSNYPDCISVIQELFFEDGRDKEVRFGYYALAKNGTKKGRWIWAQFCPIAPPQDFIDIFKKAKQIGIL